MAEMASAAQIKKLAVAAAQANDLLVTLRYISTHSASAALRAKALAAISDAQRLDARVATVTGGAYKSVLALSNGLQSVSDFWQDYQETASEKIGDVFDWITGSTYKPNGNTLAGYEGLGNPAVVIPVAVSWAIAISVVALTAELIYWLNTKSDSAVQFRREQEDIARGVDPATAAANAAKARFFDGIQPDGIIRTVTLVSLVYLGAKIFTGGGGYRK